MKRSIYFWWSVLLLSGLAACGNDANEAGEADVTETDSTELAAVDRPLEEAARAALDTARFLPNSVGRRVLAIVQDNPQPTQGQIEIFRHLTFEKGRSVVEEDDPGMQEIDELAMVLNAYPRLNVEIAAFADQGDGKGGQPQYLARMRTNFIKARLLDHGIEAQMINTRAEAGQAGDNHVEVRVMGY